MRVVRCSLQSTLSGIAYTMKSKFGPTGLSGLFAYLFSMIVLWSLTLNTFKNLYYFAGDGFATCQFDGSLP